MGSEGSVPSVPSCCSRAAAQRRLHARSGARNTRKSHRGRHTSPGREGEDRSAGVRWGRLLKLTPEGSVKPGGAQAPASQVGVRSFQGTGRSTGQGTGQSLGCWTGRPQGGAGWSPGQHPPSSPTGARGPHPRKPLPGTTDRVFSLQGGAGAPGPTPTPPGACSSAHPLPATPLPSPPRPPPPCEARESPLIQKKMFLLPSPVAMETALHHLGCQGPLELQREGGGGSRQAVRSPLRSGCSRGSRDLRLSIRVLKQTLDPWGCASSSVTGKKSTDLTGPAEEEG